MKVLLDSATAQEIIRLVRIQYPDWNGFGHPGFEQDEVTYKQETVTKAKGLINEEELRRLINAGEYEEVQRRLEELGKDNNLLWRNIPLQGDLNILYQDHLDLSSFCWVVLDLLYGEGTSGERLARYVTYVQAHELPLKWTFPTYFLFICHPEDELFIKPQTTCWFFRIAGRYGDWKREPNQRTYSVLKQLGAELMSELDAFGPRDMVDIQSIIWVAANTAKNSEKPRVGDGESSDPWAVQVAGWLEEEFPPERYELRLECESTAREVLEDNLGQLSREQVQQVFSLINTDYWQEEVAHSRFSPAFSGHNRNEMLRQLGGFNEWVARLWQAEEVELEALLDEFWNGKTLQNAGTSVPTLILYLKDWDRYNIWLDSLAKGLEAITGFSTEGTSGADYLAYNARVNEIRRRFSLEPQAVDAILARASREQTNNLALAEPFASLFDNAQEALWALRLLAETLKRLGVKSPDDERFSVSLRRRKLRLIYGGWLVMEFDSSKNSYHQVRFDLLVDMAGPWESYRLDAFSQSEEEAKVNGYLFPVSVVREQEEQILAVHWPTVDYIRERFEHWKATQYRSAHRQALGKALFAPGEFQRLIAEGLDEAPEAVEEAAFDEQTFALLAQLHDNPTNDFYQKHKKEFVEYLEEPFQELVREVAGKLPLPISESMETERHLFSRIPKNDYGRGGAWAHYWSAFYPKGSKRTEDAQLFVSINHKGLMFGFDIGDHSHAGRETFWRNLGETRPLIREALVGLLAQEELLFGEEETLIASLDEWLNANRPQPRAMVRVSPAEVLAIPTEELSDRIAEAFAVLFPLVLLATSTAPAAEIRRYLDVPGEVDVQPDYSLEQCAADTGLAPEELGRWLRALQRKGQAVLYGPPGTGKTYVAKQLARHLVGGSDGFWEVVQFHPAYAYEDFILGIRPQTSASGGLEYPAVPGRFLSFCRRAAERQGPCVLIIDEINRANLSRVFGELIYLLEYREERVPLSVDGRPFAIPENVRIIGTMNTADRSIALVDHALRRRFAFIGLYPNYDILTRWHRELGGFDVTGLVATLKEVNMAISDRNYEIGISFFLKEDIEECVADIWRMEIEPYLEEYFFDRLSTVEQFRWDAVKGKILPP